MLLSDHRALSQIRLFFQAPFDEIILMPNCRFSLFFKRPIVFVSLCLSPVSAPETCVLAKAILIEFFVLIQNLPIAVPHSETREHRGDAEKVAKDA